VEQIGFRILAEETTPAAAVEKGEDIGAEFEFAAEIIKLETRDRGESPLHHFGVGSGGEIGAAEGRLRSDPLGGSNGFEPGGIFLEGAEEVLEPTVFVAVFESAGPDAEFLHVVAERGDAAGTKFGRAAEEIDIVVDGAERYEIAQFLEAGKNPDGFATVFGDVGAEEFLGLETGGEEWKIVDEGVTDVSFREGGRQLRFPDAFGKPGARGAFAEVFFEVIGEAGDLFDAIGLGNGDQDRFVETAADQFDLAGSDEIAEADEIVRMMFFDPEKERAGVMDGKTEGGVSFDEAKKAVIGVAEAPFEDGVEIPCGLVGVKNEREMELGARLGRRAHRPSYREREGELELHGVRVV